MIEIPVEDFIFVVCALVGGGLLLITVLVDDILGAVFDFDIGGVSLMPLLLSFVSMFGVGGLFATPGPRRPRRPGGGRRARLRAGRDGPSPTCSSAPCRAEAPTRSRPRTSSARRLRQVGIPAGRYGSVLVKAEGQTHEFSATASADIAAGTTVARDAASPAPGLIVEPIDAAAATGRHRPRGGRPSA